MVSCVAFSPDGSTLASGGSGTTIGLWDVAQERGFEGHTGWVTDVAFSPDGATLVSGSDDAAIRLWNPTTGALGTLKGHISYVTSIAFSPDGATLAWESVRAHPPMGCRDRRTRSLGRYLSHANSIAFSPDGLTLAGGSNHHTIYLWNVKTGAYLRTLQNDTGLDYSIAFSADGSTMASWNGETTIRL